MIYPKVASKEQAKEGFSIPPQLKLLRALFAAAEKIRVVEERAHVENAKQAGRSNFGDMVGYLHQHR